MAKREPPDVEALQQRVADLEALLVSPGWAIVSAEASRLYGQRAFTDEMMGITRGASAQMVGEHVIAVVEARKAALLLMHLPEEKLDEAKRKLAAVTKPKPPAQAFGGGVEYST